MGSDRTVDVVAGARILRSDPPTRLIYETAGERAKEIDVPQRTLARKADEFEKLGMQSLFSSEEHGGTRESSLTLPGEIRQLIVIFIMSCLR